MKAHSSRTESVPAHAGLVVFCGCLEMKHEVVLVVEVALTIYDLMMPNAGQSRLHVQHG
jgi:chemotaxis protein CheY-P-specific phosphatase CheC